MSIRVPELLAPAGSLDAVRAAVANGANAVYLGASRFNARDDGAQLSLDELAQACALAHGRGVRVYLTFNVLLKAHELVEALEYLGECVDRGIDAAIVQDLGAVPLIRAIYPSLEVHGSTQMTVHDGEGAALVASLGVERVVLARENTLSDIAAIRAAVPTLGLETFIHGALCISYSGQCFMSGMISERSANRGSCAQSCRKDYVLADASTGDELDRGFLISARDLSAQQHLDAIREQGVGCLKIEGRKKKPEYVASVTRAYRGWLDAMARGEHTPVPPDEEPMELVQIFSRGNTGGMYGGRMGRDYVTRSHPDNRGVHIGSVRQHHGERLVLDVGAPLAIGDGLAVLATADAPEPIGAGTVLRVVTRVGGGTDVELRGERSRPAIPPGALVYRTHDKVALARAQSSFADVRVPDGTERHAVDVRVFGVGGAPLKTVWSSGTFEVTVRSAVPLAAATARALELTTLREQFSRLGDTRWRLAAINVDALAPGLFLPIGELNRLRQHAVQALEEQFGWAADGMAIERRHRIETAVAAVPGALAATSASAGTDAPSALRASVFSLDDALAAADGGAHEIVFDPFLRHPAPPLARVARVRDALAARGVAFRLRTPTIARPDDRPRLDRWLALGLPLQTAHVGIAGHAERYGNVIADYGTNVFNPHTAALLFARGVSRIVASVELTSREIAALVAPWGGAGFDVVLYGRPEGMTIEHCVLSAAFDREPTTCRDLCVQKYPDVRLTDPAHYTFAVATDSDCRNRLLHSRPIDGSEHLCALHRAGLRGFQLLFNVPGDPVEAIVRAYRAQLDAVDAGEVPDIGPIRALLGREFTRGHFQRAV